MRSAELHPDVVPILSTGRHRSPRRGACFMEFASFLAGEHWSDHPKCTHGTLAHLARLVNDRTSDAGRARLTPLIPSVVGLTSDDPLLDVLLAVRAAHAALPVAAEERQRSQAVGLRAALAALADRDDESSAGARELAESALRSAPAADAWAIRFIDEVGRGRPRTSVKQCRDVITGAVDGIATAAIGDRDDRLVALLAAAVSDTERLVGRTAEPTVDVRERADAGVTT
ncbi:hypothetical protein GCM10017608_04650 [Agromyces luteolus]|uniref:Uncharacterized protein n=1 Tax=Agromyces luteolus TaxID=88373 RepID=A0A7C9LCC6_9MICO|nr:hypothetical protein [Agromyces luteolus]MUN06432.1 hypothetical protein [Agromyces luteolus]GLK26533.1 hypothetical protein GCM10017608_04650 [Agromyces luteolus]